MFDFVRLPNADPTVEACGHYVSRLGACNTLFRGRLSTQSAVRPKLLQNKMQSLYTFDGYNYDSTSIRRPFDCLSEVIKVTVT